MKPAVLISLLSALSYPSLSQSSQLSFELKRVKLDSMITLWESKGLFNGGIIITQKGTALYHRSAGYANFEAKTPNTDTTRFNLASVSKPLTSIAILQLVHQKKLSLTEPVVRYLPDFPYSTVTIGQLLSHTSGLPEADQYEKPYILAHPSEVLSNQKIYNELINLRVPPRAASGEIHYYNNLNYIVLALLAEKVTRTPFSLYMQKHIFQQAGMKNTYIRERISANTARYFRPTFYDTAFYHVDSIRNRKIYTNYPLGGTYGDNNVISTLRDMALFDKALAQGKLLPLEMVKYMYQPVKLANGAFFFTGGKKTYTLGWNVNEKNFLGQFAVWHDGSLVGLTTMLFKNQTDDIMYMMYENRNVPGFFQRFLAISNVVDGVKVTDVSLQKSLVREYGASLAAKGVDYAAARFNELKNDPGWYFNEQEMNELGYNLLRQSDLKAHKALALEVFKLNTMLFPKSANTYDSYAEALMEAGSTEEAIMMYQKTIQFQPNNEPAKGNLKKLTGQ